VTCPSRSPDLTPMVFFFWGHVSWFTSHQLILKRILLPVLLMQQQPGIFECTRQSVISCVSRSVAYVWTSAVLQCFFRILQWFCLISNHSQTHFDGPWHYKDACLTYSCRQYIFVLVPPITSWSLGMEFFPHLCVCVCIHRLYMELLSQNLTICIVSVYVTWEVQPWE